MAFKHILILKQKQKKPTKRKSKENEWHRNFSKKHVIILTSITIGVGELKLSPALQHF